MDVYVEIDTEGFITGYTTTPEERLLKFTLPDDHPFFMVYTKYRVVDGKLVEDQTRIIERAMARKEAELSAQCQRCIEEGFVHVVNETPYKFSYDLIAQMNLGAARKLLEKGIQEDVMWTVKYPDTGEYTRIPLTLDLIDEVMITGEQHRQSRVAKFRDFLLPIALSSLTLEEIQKVEW